MAIAPTLRTFLAEKQIEYDLLTHEPTPSSSRTAQASGISGDRLAKAIVLRNSKGHMLAVLPASHHIDLADLKAQVGEDVRLASEGELVELFRDCAEGAVPPIGECYGLDVIVDQTIEEQPEVYLEGGDHQTLIHMARDQFTRLTAAARHGRFSKHD